MKQMGEKVFYDLKIDGAHPTLGACRVELLTGDFNNEAVSEIENLFDNIDYTKNPSWVASQVWKQIKGNWDRPGDMTLPGGLSLVIEREEPEAGFSPLGCDWCNNGLGNDVYECIEYDDATKIDRGEYFEVRLCNECRCKYHNGEG